MRFTILLTVREISFSLSLFPVKTVFLPSNFCLSLKNCNVMWMSVKPVVPLGNRATFRTDERSVWFSARSRPGFFGAPAVTRHLARSPCCEWPSVGVYFTGPCLCVPGNPRKGGSYQFDLL